MSGAEALSSLPAMPHSAITIENLGKRYTIDHQRANGDAMRHAIEGAIRAPLAWLRSGYPKKIQQTGFWALRDVSFQVEQGEVVGNTGSNGACKSTLFDRLSRITPPPEGRIRL